MSKIRKIIIYKISRGFVAIFRWSNISFIQIEKNIREVIVTQKDPRIFLVYKMIIIRISTIEFKVVGSKLVDMAWKSRYRGIRNIKNINIKIYKNNILYSVGRKNIHLVMSRKHDMKIIKKQNITSANI